jgi:MFS transporter, PAT family, beta-lactamase induction signal transducer AmpG
MTSTHPVPPPAPSEKTRSRSPWLFVPTLYFAEGVPYVLVNTVSVILYKRLGLANHTITFWTSLLYLPWVVKMLWGPLVDTKGTKRKWILVMQLLMTASLAGLALSLGLPGYFAVTLAVFTLAAFISATHDIAADGFYLYALNERQQAYFVGVRTLFYRAAMIFGSGLLVTFAGKLEQRLGNVPQAWSLAFLNAAAIYAVLCVYHRFALPYPPNDGSGTRRGGGLAWGRIFVEWFSQPRAVVIVAFILLYRLGEAMLLKLAAPFMLDSHAEGGLGFTTAQVGMAYGTVGLSCLILGGILGGWLIGRFGLRRMIWPLALCLNVPHAAYLYMAHAQPGPLLAYPLVAVEQLGYGLGTTAFMVVLMRVSRGEHRTSHYAIATGLMALGMMLPGMISGSVEEALGYRAFFLLVLLLGIPGLLTLVFLPRLEETRTS